MRSFELVPRLRARAPGHLTAPRSRAEERRRQAKHLARARPRLAETERMWESLTEREREVLALVARGWSNARIAQELAVTERTVRFHLENLFARLGVDNRVAAVVKAIRLGLLGAPE